MKTIFQFLLALALVSGCSKKATVEAVTKGPGGVIPDITNPVNQGDGSETIIMKVQDVPENVPEVEDGVSYHGYQELALGETITLELQGGNDSRAVDIIFSSKKDAEIRFSELASFFIGTCDSSFPQAVWVEMDSNNQVVDFQFLTAFDQWPVEANKNYAMRLGYENMTGCQSIQLTVGLAEVEK